MAEIKYDYQEKKSVPWVVFVWAIGIILVAMAWVLNASSSASARADAAAVKADNASAAVGEVKGDIKEINANISGIYRLLEKGRQ